jgi:hypothetical protein
MMDATPESAVRTRTLLPTTSLDSILTAQIAVAWAGEGGEQPRLRWWQSDLISTYGGEDLFSRLLPSTWKWAIYQGAREAARRRDAARQAQVNDPDRLVTMYNLGFEIDERIEERLLDLKRATSDPLKALPGLKGVIRLDWSRDDFADWVRGHGSVEYDDLPAGRRLKGEPPESLDLLVNHLVAALDPLEEEYPRPHYRRRRDH